MKKLGSQIYSIFHVVLCGLYSILCRLYGQLRNEFMLNTCGDQLCLKNNTSDPLAT